MSANEFTGIDIAIAAIVLTMTFLGYRRGFIVGVLSLTGLVLGAVIGTRIGPLILDGGAKSPYNPMFGLLGAGLAGTVLASGLEGIGKKVRDEVDKKGGRAIDGLLGCVFSFCVGLGMVWITSAALIHMPQASRNIRPQLQSSVIIRELADRLPSSGPILNTLSRYDPVPPFHGPKVLLTAPPPIRPSDPKLNIASKSVVRIVGTSCGLNVTGSGWIVKRGYVVTNAHVVAGQKETIVQVDGRMPELDAAIEYFDPINDLAILRVPELDRPALQMVGRVRPGSSGAIMGYPNSGPFDMESARIGAAESVRSNDLYDQKEVDRGVVVFRGNVRHGNSGGPVVDLNGRVVTTVFGSSTGSKQKGGYGVPNAAVRVGMRKLTPNGVPTTACVS